MSCTVLAVPYALAYVVGALVAGSAAIANNANKEIEEEYGMYNHLPIDSNITEDLCEDVHIITDKHFIEKSFETPFMDKAILLKTLEEHGVSEIKEDEYGKITGIVENYTLSLEKTESDKPYYLRITCLETDNAEEKVNDLNSEYALNTQEEAYLSIVEKLKQNNMQIEKEEVCDDNTIVLTINLD